MSTVRVDVISKKGCHFCETVTQAFLPLEEVEGCTFNVIDIADDQAVHDLYFLRIPVVLLDGRVVFEARDISDPRGMKTLIEELVSSIRRSATAHP